MVVAVIAAVGVVGSLLAWSIGPWLMATLFGEDYHVDGWVLGLLTLSATLLAILTVTGATCQATNRHAAFLGGWVVATLSTLLLLMLPARSSSGASRRCWSGPRRGSSSMSPRWSAAAPEDRQPAKEMLMSDA